MNTLGMGGDDYRRYMRESTGPLMQSWPVRQQMGAEYPPGTVTIGSPWMQLQQMSLQKLEDMGSATRKFENTRQAVEKNKREDQKAREREAKRQEDQNQDANKSMGGGSVPASTGPAMSGRQLYQMLPQLPPIGGEQQMLWPELIQRYRQQFRQTAP
jgi:hypothetical protein